MQRERAGLGPEGTFDVLAPAAVDKTLERGSGRLVAGSEQPVEVTEVWTFARRRGSSWELSAIQQTN